MAVVFLGVFVFLDQLSVPDICLGGDSWPQWPTQSAIRGAGNHLCAGQPLVPVGQCHYWHGACPDASGRLDHAVGHGKHRPESATSRSDPWCATRHRFLEDLFFAGVTGRCRGKHYGVRDSARVLRSVESSVWKECVSECGSTWAPAVNKKKKKKK